MTKKIIPLLLFFVLIQGVLAESPEKGTSQKLKSVFDPTDPSSFDYAKGDYATITDWQLIDQTKIPPQRIKDVPFLELTYTVLTAAQRQQMTIDQISFNLQKIEDLTKDIPVEKAIKALQQTYGITVTRLGKGAQVRNNQLSATYGKKDTIFVYAGNYNNGKILIDDEGRIIFTPNKDAQITIVPSDTFTLKGEDGTSFQLDGKTVEGTLHFNEGQAYLDPREKVVIDSLAVLTFDEPYTIHFDPPPAEKNAVMITPDRIEVRTGPEVQGKDTGVELMPLPGNAFFHMQKRQYEHDEQGKPIPDKFTLVPDDRDVLSLLIGKGDSLVITSRDNEGKTPLIQHHDGGGEMIVDTGPMTFTIQQGKVTHISLPIDETSEDDSRGTLTHGGGDYLNSVALELVSDSKDAGGSIVTSSSNRFVYQDDHGTTIATNTLGLRVSTRLEDNAIKTIDDLRARYPHITFNIGNKDRPNPVKSYKEITPNMAQFVVEWLEKNNVARQLTKSIIFHTEANAFAITESPGNLYFGERIVDGATFLKFEGFALRHFESITDIADHEFRHTVDEYIKENERKLFGDKTIAKEGIEAMYAKAAKLALEQLKNDPRYQAIIAEIERRTGRKIQLTEKSVRLLANPSELRKLAKGVALTKKDERELSQKYQQVVHDVLGLDSYAVYQNPETKQFHEIPTLYSEETPEKVRAEIQKGSAFFRYMTQLSYDAGTLSLEEYTLRMNGYCDTNPCGKCLAYTLLCGQKQGAYYATE